MRKYCLTLVLLIGMAGSGWAQSLASGEVPITTPAQLERMLGAELKADTVLGKPLQVGSVTLIPVVAKGMAFGMGYKQGSQVHQNPQGNPVKQDDKDGNLSGGMGFVRPVSLIIVRADGSIEVQSLSSNFLLGLVERAMPLIKEALERRFDMWKMKMLGGPGQGSGSGSGK